MSAGTQNRQSARYQSPRYRRRAADALVVRSHSLSEDLKLAERVATFHKTLQEGLELYDHVDVVRALTITKAFLAWLGVESHGQSLSRSLELEPDRSDTCFPHP